MISLRREDRTVLPFSDCFDALLTCILDLYVLKEDSSSWVNHGKAEKEEGTYDASPSSRSDSASSGVMTYSHQLCIAAVGPWWEDHTQKKEDRGAKYGGDGSRTRSSEKKE